VADSKGSSEYDHVLVTIPANYAKNLFPANPAAGALLGQIPFASSAIT
jgi:protoporphyrinogen oxidase